MPRSHSVIKYYYTAHLWVVLLSRKDWLLVDKEPGVKFQRLLSTWNVPRGQQHCLYGHCRCLWDLLRCVTNDATFLADRTNGRAYATVFRLSVCRLYGMFCGYTVRPRAKRYYWQPIGSRIWEIDCYQNEWPWHLFRGRFRSCQPLCHIRHWISRKPLAIEAWFQRTTNRKWPIGIKWSRDRWRHLTLSGQFVTPKCLERNISKTAGNSILQQSL